MKAEYRDDSVSGAGNGLFVITESAISSLPLSMALQRASDQRFLTGKKAGQWVGETYFMSLPPEKWNDGSLAFALGPEIVDSLDSQEQYRVTLRGADGAQERCRLKLGPITYSPAGSVDNTGKPAEKKQASEPPQASHRPVQPEPPQTPPLEEKPLDMEPPVQGMEEAPRSKGKSLAAIFMLIVLALACLAWWYFDKREKETLPAQNPASEPASSAHQPRGAAEQVSQFFKSHNPTPQGALELAARLSAKTSADQDALYRLYYFAAGKDEPAAMIAYGACLDPSLPKWGTINKNAPEAWEIYKKALKTEPDKARGAMNNLHAWLEKESSSGNAQAKTWLAEIDR